MVIGEGNSDVKISEEKALAYTRQALEEVDLDRKRVLVIIPDLTRLAPIPLFFEEVYASLSDRVSALDCMLALGTHQPMTDEEICKRVGIKKGELKRTFPKTRFINHLFDDPRQMEVLYTFTADEIDEISGGLMREEVPVTINRLVFDYDFIILLSPVVPHEAAGFAGGSKYLFPGISGLDTIAFFHWMAAVITNPVINGMKHNPVRTFLDRAASHLDIPRMAFHIVVHEGVLKGLYIGDVEKTWSLAADLSAKLHVKYVDRPFKTVLGIVPEYYTELWVAGKAMYKLEPVVADGGELIIYGAHVEAVSYTFDELIRRVGYHTSAYLQSNLDHYDGIPRSVLAHSANVRGIGTYKNGVEKPRIRVTLATGIQEDVCRDINLGYRDFRKIDPDEWRDREDEGILVVDRAGDALYRLP